MRTETKRKNNCDNDAGQTMILAKNGEEEQDGKQKKKSQSQLRLSFPFGVLRWLKNERTRTNENQQGDIKHRRGGTMSVYMYILWMKTRFPIIRYMMTPFRVVLVLSAERVRHLAQHDTKKNTWSSRFFSFLYATPAYRLRGKNTTAGQVVGQTKHKIVFRGCGQWAFLECLIMPLSRRASSSFLLLLRCTCQGLIVYPFSQDV